MKTKIAVLAATSLLGLLLAAPARSQVTPSPPPLAASDNVKLLGNIPGTAAG